MTTYVKRLLEKLHIEEDDVPFKQRIREQDAYLLLHSPNLGTFHNNAVSYEKGVLGECHAVTAYMCLENPNWKYCYGLAEHGECLTEWSIHSWCLNEQNQIIEPTPLIRNRYIGIELSDRFKQIFIWEELGIMMKLGFVITPEMWTKLLVENNNE